VEFIELVNWRDALTPEIQERAKNGSVCNITKQYAVREDGKEVAYVALDSYPVYQCTDLTLYEMFVPRKLRHCGVGGRILAETEKLARGTGYTRILLNAHPLENYPKERLQTWYQKHGYKSLPGGRVDDMVKELAAIGVHPAKSA